jgi:CheY-like chemotaxis protein
MTVQQGVGEEPRPPRSASSALPDFKGVDLSGIKVLVVDDEPDARNLIHRVLSDCHAQVLTAASAREALRMVETEMPHVLLSDIGMPDMDGYELLKQVRALRHAGAARLVAIALTAFARSDDRTRALRAGFLLHLSKPVEPSELVATLASATGRTGERYN